MGSKAHHIGNIPARHANNHAEGDFHDAPAAKAAKNAPSAAKQAGKATVRQ
jgi:hypothetical protein